MLQAHPATTGCGLTVKGSSKPVLRPLPCPAAFNGVPGLHQSSPVVRRQARTICRSSGSPSSIDFVGDNISSEDVKKFESIAASLVARLPQVPAGGEEDEDGEERECLQLHVDGELESIIGRLQGARRRFWGPTAHPSMRRSPAGCAACHANMCLWHLETHKMCTHAAAQAAHNLMPLICFHQTPAVIEDGLLPFGTPAAVAEAAQRKQDQERRAAGAASSSSASSSSDAFGLALGASNRRKKRVPNEFLPKV